MVATMRLRFVKPNQPKRYMVRCPFNADVVKLIDFMIAEGYKPVGLVRYWTHVLFWKKQKPKN